MKRLSVKTAILLPSIGVLIAGVIIMVITVGSLSSSTTNDLTQRLVSARVNEYSNLFNALCLDSYGKATSIGPIIDNLTNTDNPRERVIEVLTDVLLSDDSMLGVWTCWEPNAFDGRDSDFVNAPNHDSTGRFVPYIFRDGTGYGVEALEGYTIPGEGDYYLGARNSAKPYITDPYEYVVAGTKIPLYSIAVPIIRDGSVVGVVGIDIKLESIISAMNAGSILDDGYLFALSPQGIFATHPNADLILQDYTTTWIKDYASDIGNIASNGGSLNLETYSDQLNENIRFLASGVKIADTDRYWVVCGLVPERTVTASSNMLLWLIIGIGLALIVGAGITIFVVVRMRLRDLPIMTALSETIAKGDIQLTGLDTGTGQTSNEITLLGRAFAAMAKGIKSQADLMSQIAGGDYSLSVPVRCDADVMNKAINEMLERFNETMSEIRASTDQVSVGSQQIADGSQALAQGSTEQAAAVEQLSSSISEIAQKTKDNAEMADRAAKLAGTIKGNAEKGNHQMGEMMTAVREINEASQNINKVIKVIDDIAFQTNILALNAAVEAARAGQHGKGFAVVAEEVRSLAAKSAEAAKDTGSLIANSMEKAALGARIADETAASLVEIISGINESSQLVGEIARSSGEQSAGISQINTGIDQVAQVVQQNSATAEESAAASEEMSGQTNMLEELIAQFKLRDGDKGISSRRLPDSMKAPRKQLIMPKDASFMSSGDDNGFGKY